MAVGSISHDTGIPQFPPVVVVDSITHGITEGEVEDRTLYLTVIFCGIYPFLAVGGITIPELSHRVGGVTGVVVYAEILGGEALCHIVTETSIAELITEKHTKVSLHVGLYVLACMVKVAHAIPTLTLSSIHLTGSFGVGTKTIAIAVSPLFRCPFIIVSHDVG